GEHVRVEVIERSRDYFRAQVIEVLDAAPGRTSAPCAEVARGCGSCQWQHISLPTQRELKQQVVQDSLRRLARIDSPEVMPLIELPGSGYRTTIRAGVVNGRAGYRRRRENTLLTVEQCHIAHPLVEELLLQGEYGVADEVILRCASRTRERLAAPHPEGAGITVPADTRTDHLHEEVAGRRWRISARSFFQSRPDGAEALCELVANAADELTTGVAIDLYSGVGLFAGVLADRGWTVVSVESSGDAVRDARVNLQGSEVRIVRADVAKWSPPKGHLVVANPSRRGLGRNGLSTVVASGASRVVLVSCDVGTFGRDTALLRSAGYGLTAVTPVDMFPHTFHVEVVSTFDRV
ncbi:MAG: hypothetical protein M3011_12370, partial [Actinomycetota bacterium]|nr:hypothetical protein [Actinomycetota bacterium]